MLVSTKGRYALRIMLDLAMHEGETIKLKDIAKRQSISEKYMEHIIGKLNNAGLLRSTRGAQGGYSLAMSPDEYTVGMILRLTEGDLAPVECLTDSGTQCENRSCCASIEVWKRVYTAINDVIDNINLEELKNIAQEKEKGVSKQ